MFTQTTENSLRNTFSQIFRGVENILYSKHEDSMPLPFLSKNATVESEVTS